MATATVPATTQTLSAILEQLGGIAPGRVVVKHPLGMAIEADLLAMNERQDRRNEVVDGLLVKKGMGSDESVFTLALAGYLRAFVVPRNLGLVSGPDGMMRLFPGVVRIPDLAFASWDRIPGRRRPSHPIAPFASNLAIEVLSQSNTLSEMVRKRRDSFRAGVRLVWGVDLVSRTVLVAESPDQSRSLTIAQVLDGGEVLPGFILSLTDLFGELDQQGD